MMLIGKVGAVWIIIIFLCVLEAYFCTIDDPYEQDMIDDIDNKRNKQHNKTNK